MLRIMEELTQHYPDIPQPRIKNASLPIGYAGKYVSAIQTIFIDESQSQNLEVEIYHEFEHHWQFVNFPAQYSFWENPMNFDFYRRCCKESCCPLEEDAYMFGYSLGKRNCRFLVELIEVSELEKYAKDFDYQSLKNRITRLTMQNLAKQNVERILSLGQAKKENNRDILVIHHE